MNPIYVKRTHRWGRRGGTWSPSPEASRGSERCSLSPLGRRLLTVIRMAGVHSGCPPFCVESLRADERPPAMGGASAPLGILLAPVWTTSYGRSRLSRAS